MDAVETDEEALEISYAKMLPALEEMKVHMDSQNLESEDAKEYHKLRLEWFEIYSEIVKMETQALDDYVNDVITDEDLNEIVEGLYVKAENGEELAIEAEVKIEELAEKYNFELLEE